MSRHTTTDSDTVGSPSVSAVRYMAPELLKPEGFGMENDNPTEKSDVYAFGLVTYQVSVMYYISTMVIDCNVQVVTGEQPFPGAKEDVIICCVVAGERPSRPPGPNEWVSDDVWNFIARCWSPTWDGRPDVDFVMNALNDAADVVGVRRGESDPTNSQWKRVSRGRSGASYGYQPRT